MALSFVCHDTSFQVLRSLQNPTPRRWSKVVHGTMSLTFCTTALMGIFGFLSFFGDLENGAGNVLQNFPADDHAVNAARLTLAGSLFLTIPLNLFMARHVALVLWFALTTGHSHKRYEFRLQSHVLSTLLLWGVALTLALVIRDLSAVQSFVGAVFGISLVCTSNRTASWFKNASSQAYVYPAACALKVNIVFKKFKLFSFGNRCRRCACCDA